MPTPAELVLTGGPVYTPDAAGRRMVPAAAPGGRPVTAVAVTGGRITAVGARGDDRIAELTGPRTEVVSLRGRALLPGFQDAHVHPAFTGVTMVACNLMDAATLPDALAVIGAYARAHPEQEWITGSGWRMEWFPGGLPDRRALDAVVGDRPAYLVNRDWHGAWASSAALARAGIDAGTPDPPDGRIERDADGTPQGTLHEGAAGLVGALVPEPSLAQRVAGLLLAQRHLHARGVTAWQDAIIGDYLGALDPLPAYLAAAAAGQLTARVRGAVWWDRGRGAGQLPEILARRERAEAAAAAGERAARFVAGTVKIMQDGVAENQTAAMIDPYVNPVSCHEGLHRGRSHVDPQELRAYVTALDAAGFQVHVHAIGDRAVREALDAFEAARAAHGERDHRHHIAHLQVVQPADVPRFAALGVTANMQALWAAHEPQLDELTVPFLGPERSARQYVFGELRDAGARLAAGSDWGVTSANPLKAIHVAVNRALPGATGADAEPFLPAQRLDLAEALAAYTLGSAYVNHLDSETGRVRPGFLADLAVLAADPFAGRADEIGNISVDQTYVSGERVFGG
ncbi:MAG TPA: amidohydrolase [Streptosporangiaceae bacterium]|nr:amidohydrolase [Streptosporangiaceae bacterium]